MMTKEAVLRWEKDCRDTYLNDFSADTIVEFTKPLYARVDAYTTGKTTGERSVIELKKRNIPSTKYENEGFILEKIKYDALKEAQKRSGEDSALYINIFDDKYICWDINKISAPKWEKRLCTATTAEDYGKVKELKDVTLLDKEEALWTKDRLSKN